VIKSEGNEIPRWNGHIELTEDEGVLGDLSKCPSPGRQKDDKDSYKQIQMHIKSKSYSLNACGSRSMFRRNTSASYSRLNIKSSKEAT
jgi:hypothetical protein